MAYPPLSDPVPRHLPPGFVAFPNEAMEGRGAMIATGPVTPVHGPTECRMRQYVPAPASVEALEHGPVIRVGVSYASSLPPEWFEGLVGEPVDVSGSDGYYRSGRRQVSLIILRRDWVIEVMTEGVSKAETLEIARSLDFA